MDGDNIVLSIKKFLFPESLQGLMQVNCFLFTQFLGAQIDVNFYTHKPGEMYFVTGNKLQHYKHV